MTLRHPAWMAVAALALSACANTPSPAAADDVRRVQYRCDNGETVEVHYVVDRGRATLRRGGRSLELQQHPAASGFYYVNGPHALRGKGDELMIETGRMVPLRCMAQ
jgi:membrane-bound inhibitor of C-type lysozyme